MLWQSVGAFIYIHLLCSVCQYTPALPVGSKKKVNLGEQSPGLGRSPHHLAVWFP